MAPQVSTLENLAFEGGGVRGIAYAGAVQALDDYGLLTGIKRVAGTSAGAFAALLLALDMSPTAMRDALRSIHFKTLEDKPNPLRLATHYGLYKGDILFDWIAAQVTGSGLHADLSFEQLRSQGARDLCVFATDLNQQTVRRFSADTTPDASVVGAVRASMSIPLMYAVWQFPDGKPDRSLYVDGGAVYNYPINAFDNREGSNPNTLGFCFIQDKPLEQGKALGLDSPLAYAHSLFATLARVQKIDLDANPTDLSRSVRINDLGFHATDLSLSDDAFNRLFSAGHEATVAHLDKTGRSVAP